VFDHNEACPSSLKGRRGHSISVRLGRSSQFDPMRSFTPTGLSAKSRPPDLIDGSNPAGSRFRSLFRRKSVDDAEVQSGPIVPGFRGRNRLFVGSDHRVAL